MWIGWVITGLVSGLLARFFTPGHGPQGCIITTILGIGGAVLAGFVGRQLGIYGPHDQASLLAAVFGAIAILLITRNIRF